MHCEVVAGLAVRRRHSSLKKYRILRFASYCLSDRHSHQHHVDPGVENHQHSLLEADELSAFDLVRFDSDRRQLQSVNVVSKSKRYRFLVEADLGLDESVDAVEGLVS